jgi:hypothetical protein|uniref:Srp40 C-terminal domain-containing protein n=1 Tax=Eutreptiella gymnastica TaxID=73025 RepID=A0A7S4LKM0_9EUGL
MDGEVARRVTQFIEQLTTLHKQLSEFTAPAASGAKKPPNLTIKKPAAPVVRAAAPPSDDDSSSDSSSDSSDDDHPPPAKAPKLNPAASPLTPTTPASQHFSIGGVNEHGEKQRFQRVDSSRVKILQGLEHNDYIAPEDDFAQKAHAKVGGYTGKMFRKEKTKGKRSTYMCGEITSASRSFKYDSDSD